MPKTSTWTELLGPALIEQIDDVGDAIKDLIGWPPLGVSELSPSGARAREDRDGELLGDFLIQLGPEMGLQLVQRFGPQLMEKFGLRVVQGAIRRASVAYQRTMGADGRETFMEDN